MNKERTRNSTTEQLHSVEISIDCEGNLIEKIEMVGLAARKVHVSYIKYW
jgi:hypothetical protein